jgi:hypothetical protein
MFMVPSLFDGLWCISSILVLDVKWWFGENPLMIIAMNSKKLIHSEFGEGNSIFGRLPWCCKKPLLRLNPLHQTKCQCFFMEQGRSGWRWNSLKWLWFSQLWYDFQVGCVCAPYMYVKSQFTWTCHYGKTILTLASAMFNTYGLYNNGLEWVWSCWIHVKYSQTISLCAILDKA